MEEPETSMNATFLRRKLIAMRPQHGAHVSSVHDNSRDTAVAISCSRE